MSLSKTIYSKEHKYLVRKLREAREQAGFTQKQVAMHLGVGQAFISKLESGQYRIDIVQLQRFAELYGKNVDFFIMLR